MDVFSNNRTKINTERIEKIDDIIMVFVANSPSTGVWDYEIESPIDGIFNEVRVTGNTKGLTDTVFQIEVCEASSYDDDSPIWEPLGVGEITLNGDSKKSSLSLKEHGYSIKKGDVVRLVFINVGTSIHTMTIQLKIEVKM